MYYHQSACCEQAEEAAAIANSHVDIADGHAVNAESAASTPQEGWNGQREEAEHVSPGSLRHRFRAARHAISVHADVAGSHLQVGLLHLPFDCRMSTRSICI